MLVNDLGNRLTFLSIEFFLTYNAKGLLATNETKIQVCQTIVNGRMSPLIIIVATDGCLQDLMA